jgi:nicotinic acid mononucleotide adenylyltransferase
MNGAELLHPLINQCDNKVVAAIRGRAYLELDSMAKILNSVASRSPYADISFTLDALLDDAALLLSTGEINPFVNIRTSADQSQAPISDETLRIGVYPVAANPLHWAHLLIGLSVLTRFKLDTVIYIISGNDPRKPALVNAEDRHYVGQKILHMFAPFFKYSSIALAGHHDGETNIFKILALNPLQKIKAYYIAGSDHYQRINPATGFPDTIQKLENNITNRLFDFNEKLHGISAIFIKRGPLKKSVRTFLDVSFIQEMPFVASSTLIRDAFQGKQPASILGLLPYTAFKFADCFQAGRNVSGRNTLEINSASCSC